VKVGGEVVSSAIKASDGSPEECVACDLISWDTFAVGRREGVIAEGAMVLKL
jgi:hypothetical protein